MREFNWSILGWGGNVEFDNIKKLIFENIENFNDLKFIVDVIKFW